MMTNLAEKIDAARAAVTRAREWLTKIEHHKTPVSPLVLVEARTQVELDEARLNQLAQQHEAQQQARAAGAKAVAKTVKDRREQLESARAVVVEAVRGAQEALLALEEAGADFSALVREQAGELAAAGLVGIAEGEKHGGNPKDGVVALDGKLWHACDTGKLIDLVAERVRFARCEPAKYYRVHLPFRGLGPQRAAHSLVSDVAPPSPVTYRSPWADVQRAPIVSTVIFQNAQERERAEEANRNAYKVDDPNGGWPAWSDVAKSARSRR